MTTWWEWSAAALTTASFCACTISTYLHWAWRWKRPRLGLFAELAWAALIISACIWAIVALAVRIPR